MDSATLKLLQQQPDVDRLACQFVKLVAAAKADREYGEAGLVCELRDGAIIAAKRIGKFTDKM